MCKNLELLEQVIFKYHPHFESKKIQDFARNHPTAFNVELLIEETFAHMGDFYHSPSIGYDLITENGNVVEVKTSTVYKNSGLDVATFQVGAKIGNIVAVVYNKFAEEKVLFLFISNERAMNSIKNSHKKKHLRTMRITMSDKPFSILSECKVSSFEELCILGNMNY